MTRLKALLLSLRGATPLPTDVSAVVLAFGPLRPVWRHMRAVRDNDNPLKYTGLSGIGLG